jgi:peptide/nickel transport system substrate-binding protein
MEKRRAIVHQCQEFLYRENPLVIVLHQNALAAYNKEDFRDPVIPKGAAFLDPLPFFTIKPTGNRKIFRVGSVAADIKTLNPLLTAESETVIYSNLMYDMLLRIGPDGKPQLWVAKEVKPIDQKTIEVSIREDLKFHDGKPLTAEDVKFTFDFMIKHKAVYYRTVLGPVESVDMVNRYKVRFHLKEPYAPFVTLTLAMVPLLPKHIWEKIENPTEYRNEPLIGSGPFKFDYWRKGQEIKMSRFSEHFRPPYVDGLLFIFGSLEAANMGLIKKESDLCYRVLLPHQMETFKNYSHIQQ